MLKNNFNGGIFGEKLHYRADLEKYQSSVAELENFFVLPYGGIENRPGTTMLTQTKRLGDCRMEIFQFNNQEKFLLLFERNYLSIFDINEHNKIKLIKEFYTKYTDIQLLNFEQKGDYFFIAYGDVYPHVLKRYSDDYWEYEKFELKYFPYTDNTDENLTLSVSDVEDNIVTIKSSADFFDPKMTGAKLQIFHRAETNSINITFTANGESDILPIYGEWELVTTGSWVGKLELQKSQDNGSTWETKRELTANANKNIDITGLETEYNSLYRLKYSGWEKAPEGVLYECRVSLSMSDRELPGVAEIAQYISPTEIKATVIHRFVANHDSNNWALEAWNDYYGYPKVISFYSGDRLIFANTKQQPQTLWMSTVGDYNNFYNGTQADSALTWTLATKLYNEINWLINKKDVILIGLANEIGILSGKEEKSIISIDNRKYSTELELSASQIQPIKVGETLLALKRGNQTLLELAYDWQNDGYLAPNMTLLAPDILQEKVIQIAYQENPYPVVYFILADGSMRTFTYNRGENVTGWAKHSTNGRIKSIAIAINETDYDDIYLAVERNNRIFIEKMAKRVDDNPLNMIFTDCSEVFDIDEKTELNIPHLAGETVSCLLDGGVEMQLKIGKDGKIILPYPARKIVIGLPYSSSMKTLPFELMQGSESTLAKKKICQNILAKLYNSLGGEFSTDGKNYSPIINRKTRDNLGEALTPKIQAIDMALKATYAYETVIYFRQTAPLPATLLAIEAEVIN